MVKNRSLGIDLVIREIESIVNEYHQNGIELYSLQKFEEAEKQAQKILEIERLKSQIQEIGIRLGNLIPIGDISVENEDTQSENLRQDKLPKGLRTPDKEFRQPILIALEKLGGSGHINDVMEIVSSLMESKLNKYDFQPLKSAPKFPRWRNTAQWERDTMVKEGLLLKDSPRSIWTLSAKGKSYLQSQKQTQKIDGSEALPDNLRYVIEVYKYMKTEKKAFESACVKIGAKNGHINPTIIRESCTDLLGITKEELESYLDLEDNFIGLIIDKYPSFEHLIKNNFIS